MTALALAGGGAVISQDFAALAALLPLAGFASYVRDTVRGRARPNRVSWSLWAAAPMIAFAAELAKGTGLRVALVTLTLGAGPALTVLATFVSRQPGARPERHWQLTRFDYACGACGVLALALWAITGQGDMAIAFAIAAELFAGLPTITKTWSDPESETVGTYLASGAGSGITLLIIAHPRFASYSFPLAVTAECAVIIALITLRPLARRRATSASTQIARAASAAIVMNAVLILAVYRILAPLQTSRRGVFVAAGLVVAATAGMLIALWAARSRPGAAAGPLPGRPPEPGPAVRPQPLPFPLFAAPVADDLEVHELDGPELQAPDVGDLVASLAEDLEILAGDGAGDCRGVAFVAHCLLNQNAKAGEGAYCAGISAPVLDALRAQGWRIEQMPCPELAFAGLRRWWTVREQLDTVGYRRHCRSLADTIAERIAVHTRQGRPVVLVGVDGSPSMGVHVTLSDPACGGRPVQAKTNAELVPGEGILIEELRWALTLVGLRFPPAGAETHDLPGHDVAVQRIQLESLLSAAELAAATSSVGDG